MHTPIQPHHAAIAQALSDGTLQPIALQDIATLPADTLLRAVTWREPYSTERGIFLVPECAINALNTTAIAVLLAWFGPAIDDYSAEREQAADLQAAINASIAQGRFDRAAQAVCGPQSPWVQTSDGSVQCSTKHGRPTITVRVSP